MTAVQCPLGIVFTWTLFVRISGVIGAPVPASWWDKHVESISCVRPGYFVNPSDCHNFYRCVDRSTWKKSALQRYDFTCPSGMVFDPAFSVCTKPGTNGCADPWWAGGGGGQNARKDEGRPFGKTLENLERESSSSPSNESNEQNSSENPLEDPFPSLFGSSETPSTTSRPSNSGASRPGGRGIFGGGGGELNNEFSTPSTDRSTRPSVGGGLGVFGGSGGGGLSAGDPLDDEFGSLPVGDKAPGQNENLSNADRGNNAQPGSATPFDNSNASGDDPLEAEFGSSPGGSLESEPARNFNSVPPFLRDRDSSNPGRKPDSTNIFDKGKVDDPLEAEFGSAPDVSGEPARNFNSVPPFLRDSSDDTAARKPDSLNPFGKGKVDDPLEAEFGSAPGGSAESEPPKKFNSVPPFLGDSSREPGRRPNSLDLFDQGNIDDPLDAAFGSPPGQPEPTKNPNSIPPLFGDSRNPTGSKRPPSTESPFGSGAVGDTNRHLPDSKWDNNYTGGGLIKCGSNCSNNDRKNGQKGTRPGSNGPVQGGGGDWWAGGNPNSPSSRDPTNNNSNSLEFDNWDSGFPSLNENNKNPGEFNWGDPSSPSSNPGIGETPWRPSTGPYGPGSSNHLGSESPPTRPPPQQSRPASHPPPPQRPSWWDPPFAEPYRASEPGPLYANPQSDPPIPWSYAYHQPRYPAYQIVTYPTWQDNRSPIIIVYSNSKK